MNESDALFLGLGVMLLLGVSEQPLTGLTKMAAADFQKLVDNMKRASGISARAADHAVKHAAIMDRVEQRMNLNNENMTKLAEYEKLMAAMDALDNGGPPLDDTFPQAAQSNPAPIGFTAPPATPPPLPLRNQSTSHFHDSGKQL